MILDGWGKSPDPKVSAIDNANTPFIDSLYTNYPHAQLLTHGENVGLPEGQISLRTARVRKYHRGQRSRMCNLSCYGYIYICCTVCIRLWFV